MGTSTLDPAPTTRDQRDEQAQAAYRLVISGQVQGVGFRPHVYRLAQTLGLSGWVRNRIGLVEIHIQGCRESLQSFIDRVIRQAPPLSTSRLEHCREVAPLAVQGFAIHDSKAAGPAQIHVPPDLPPCEDCLTELNDPGDWRYRYPFINCTQCGPRYTLIRALPYDRAVTTMAGFALCARCRQEYTNPADRRFHAEPVACPDCGPTLEFHLTDGSLPQQGNRVALQACIGALRTGRVVAIKGIGGYHLMCMADQDAAIAHLRSRKPRPHKPLAVMFPTPLEQPLKYLEQQVDLTPAQIAMLSSPIRPIVLATRRPGCSLSHQIAPGLNEIGVLLPYSPLHHLILNACGAPLIATSANISGEPVLTEKSEVEARLGHVAEAFLHHDRPIARPADDPVYRAIDGRLRPLRLGRGCVPLELPLPCRLEQPVLATGGHMKNTIALAWDDRILISPHIGDLGTARSLDLFSRTITDLQALYGVRATKVLSDAHPGYASTRWAERCGLPLQRIFHHQAHASGVYADGGGREDWLVFTWDGVGYGEDGTLQGGEALLGRPGRWQRFASLRPFYLPGGERASREPWRSAAALCWETDRDLPWLPEGAALARHAWERRLNSPQTTAVGRLFDAAAALTGLCHQASFEGQGPMLLEAACKGEPSPLQLPLTATTTGLWVSDWEPLLPVLLDETWPIGARAAWFHATLANTLLQQARQARALHGIRHIGLSGGVFQNRILTEQAARLLTGDGFSVALPTTVPVNDAGLSYGQVIEVASGTVGDNH